MAGEFDRMHRPMSARACGLLEKIAEFMDSEVYPNESIYYAQLGAGRERFAVPPVIEELKKRARAAGLWNLFLPNSDRGAGLSNYEYAHMAELMGHVQFAAEVFNCSAPDTGNMEILERFGTAEQKARYLEPLLAGTIRSSFCMTEPEVASSDATNIRTSIRRDGDSYVIDGHKWWITNAYHPNNGLLIVMGKTNPDAPRHLQQSQILVDPNTPGIRRLRPLPVFGYFDEPKGHAELIFEGVRVPASNLLGAEGEGFEIAQSRLGPGRIHHCMRIVGHCERLLKQCCIRLTERVAFGKPLAEQSLWQDRVADARTNINMCRLLTQHTAGLIDSIGVHAARSEIAQIKVAATKVGQQVADLAIQAFGAAGLCDDHGLGSAFARMRMLRIGDGPDEVHNRTIARLELEKYGAMRTTFTR